MSFGNCPISPIWVREAAEDMVDDGESVYNIQAAVAQMVVCGKKQGQRRPLVHSMVDAGHVGPNLFSGAHFNIPGLEIRHLDKILGRWRASAILPWTKYGSRGNGESFVIGKGGNRRTGGQKTLPNA